VTVVLDAPRPAVDLRPARTDATVRSVAATVVGVSLLVVTWLWVAGGGIGALTGWAGALESLGRWTGLVASDLLLVQVLLMARIPVVERAVGQDRLARWHRLTGFTSFNLMLAHVGLITWGYAAGDLAAVPGTFWDLTVTYPGMLLALAGTLCLVMVVVTSIRAARSRLRYESWHLLHLYAYLGVGLAMPHQLWTGQEFLSSTAATAYWWSLWVAAVAAILVFRAGLPVARTLRHDLRVRSVVAEDAPGVVSVYIGGRDLDRLPVTAGQFLFWRFLTGPGWSRAHPYSLSAAPDGRSLRITVKDLGDGSALVRRLRPGTRVVVEGPYGRLTQRPRTRARIALLGAGVGVTPLRALAEGLPYAPGDAVLLQRATAQPLFGRELDVLAAERGLRSEWLAGPRRSPDSWLGTDSGPGADLDVLLQWIPDVAERDVYICGPQRWTDAVRHTLTAAGLPPARLHVEIFGW
jgi:predicted ferric reductase